MNAHRIETKLNADRTLILPALPFTPGTSLEVIILERSVAVEASPPTNCYPLRGTSYQLDAPFEPVAVEDWESAK